MADSTEDLKREMEEFERGEETEAGSMAPVETQASEGPARRQIPAWIYWVILFDVLLVGGVLLYLMV